MNGNLSKVFKSLGRPEKFVSIVARGESSWTENSFNYIRLSSTAEVFKSRQSKSLGEGKAFTIFFRMIFENRIFVNLLRNNNAMRN